MRQVFCVAALAAALLGNSFSVQAAGVEFGVGQTSDSTMTYRLGMQSDWDKSWWQTDVGRLTGYWSGAYTFWDGDKEASNHSLSFSPVLVYASTLVSISIILASGLSFLGLGVSPPTADWGSMVRDNAVLITFGDISPLLPALAVALITVSVNFVVDWMLHKSSGLKEC